MSYWWSQCSFLGDGRFGKLGPDGRWSGCSDGIELFEKGGIFPVDSVIVEIEGIVLCWHFCLCCYVWEEHLLTRLDCLQGGGRKLIIFLMSFEFSLFPSFSFSLLPSSFFTSPSSTS